MLSFISIAIQMYYQKIHSDYVYLFIGEHLYYRYDAIRSFPSEHDQSCFWATLTGLCFRLCLAPSFTGGYCRSTPTELVHWWLREMKNSTPEGFPVTGATPTWSLVLS